MTQLFLLIFYLSMFYFLFFWLFSELKARFVFWDKLIFCSVCFVWASVFLLNFYLSMKYQMGFVLIAFLLGLSLTGISYKIDELLEERNRRFIMRFFLIELFFTITGIIFLYIIGGLN